MPISPIVLDQIIYDLQACGGISVRWTELAQRLAQAGLPLTLVPAQSQGNAFYWQPAGLPVLQEAAHCLPLKLRRMAPVMARAMPCRAVFHSSYYRTCPRADVKNVVTVHDFVNERYGHGLKAKLHTWFKIAAIRRAAHIICVSASTKQDLLAALPDIPADRVSVIYNAPSALFRPIAVVPRDMAELAAELSRIAPYLLFVGSRTPYKRFPLAIAAAAACPGKHLLVVGGGALTDEERKQLDHELPGRWSHRNFVASEELNLIYNRSFCLLHTSEYEGFGIPMVEAQRAGTLAVCGDNSAMPEVQGVPELMVRSNDATAFAAQLRLLDEPGFRLQAVAKGMAHAAKFSWDQAHAQELSIYQGLQA